MADNIGIFAPEAVPEGWFAPEAQADGWFDADLLDTASSGGITATLSQSIGTITGTGTGEVDINAALAGQLAPVTLASSGSLVIAAQLTATLDPITLASTGSLTGSGLPEEEPVRGGGGSVTKPRRKWRLLIDPEEVAKFRGDWRSEAEAVSRETREAPSEPAIEVVAVKAVGDGLAALRTRAAALGASASRLELEAARREAGTQAVRMAALEQENDRLLTEAMELEFQAVQMWIASELRRRMNQQAVVALVLAAA